jgi:hypothetical protein
MMAAKNPIPHENLGKTLETFGGKSAAALYGGMAAIGVPTLVAFGFALVNAEYRMPAIAAGCVLALILLMYVATNLIAVRTKVEVCDQGIHIFKRSDVNSLRWEDINLVEVGRHFLNGKPRWGVSIHANTGECIDLGPDFWDAAGQPSKFVNVVKRFTNVQMG